MIDATGTARLGLSTVAVVLASALGGCARDVPVRFVPTETLPARAAIDAHWDVADAQVGQAVRDGTIVGAEVLIVTTEGWSARGFGWATARRRPDEVTVFELGSISKVFTGTLLADMALRGEVALTTPARNLIPGRGRMPPSSRPITLMDLATHMSGLPRLPPGLKKTKDRGPYAEFAPDDLWPALERTQLERQPGVAKEYSNYAVGLLGQLLVEEAEADDYQELLHERILGPLGMDDTTVELRSDQEERFAWGHKKTKERAPAWFIPGLAGAGGLRSTARDMAKFVQAHLRRDSPIAAAADVALAPRNVPGDGKWDQGLGWVVARDGGIAWHNGATGGFHTWLGIDRASGVGVLVLCNTQVGEVDGWGMTILTGLRRKLGGQPVADDGTWNDEERRAGDAPLDDGMEVASR